MPKASDQSSPSFAQTSTSTRRRFFTQVWPCQPNPPDPGVPQTPKPNWITGEKTLLHKKCINFFLAELGPSWLVDPKSWAWEVNNPRKLYFLRVFFLHFSKEDFNLKVEISYTWSRNFLFLLARTCTAAEFSCDPWALQHYKYILKYQANIWFYI